jgi:hypothetical protein
LRYAITVALLAGLGTMPAESALGTESAAGLETWDFLIGDGWNLTERQYTPDGDLSQEDSGLARFSYVMDGQRIQELQTLEREEGTGTALQILAYDPETGVLEIVRTDSNHSGFWVLTGSLAEDRIDLQEKHPNPDSAVLRRITYRRTGPDRFVRELAFSRDQGATWFVRSEWIYTRQ